MNISKCIIPSTYTAQLANDLNLPEPIVRQKIDSWLLVNNTDKMPTKEELLAFIKLQSDKQKIFIEPSVLKLIQEDTTNGDIVNVLLGNSSYIVTVNGAIFDGKTGRLITFRDGSTRYQQIMDKAIELFPNIPSLGATNPEEENTAKLVSHEKILKSKKSERDGMIIGWDEEPEEYKEHVKKAKEKAAKMHINYHGSAWNIIASRGYGFDPKNNLTTVLNMIGAHSYEDAWENPSKAAMDLLNCKDPFTFRKKLNSLYEDAMIARGLSPSQIEKISNNSRSKNIEERLAYLQVLTSDSLFVIGHIVNPGEKYTTYDGSERVNTSSVPIIPGLNGLYLQYANSLEDDRGNSTAIPVHIYDDTREDGGWFTLKDGKYIKEEKTPSLTDKALVVHQKLPYLKGKRLNDLLGEKNFSALKEIFAKTFGFTSHYNYFNDDRGIDVTELGEARQLVNEAAKEYTTNIDDIDTIENERVKLSLSIPDAQRRARVEMMSRDFSSVLTSIEGEEIEHGAKDELAIKQKEFNDLYNKYAPTSETPEEEAKEGRKKIAAGRRGLEKQKDYLEALLKADDFQKLRQLVLQHVQLETIFDRMKAIYQNKINSDSLTDELKAKYQLVLDNFDILIQEALEKAQYSENFRIIPVKSKESNTLQTNLVKAAVVQEDEDDQFGDDPEGERSTGNDGWSFKVRLVDPRRSLSLKTKYLLYNIPLLDDNGNKVYDDLGNLRYVNGEYAHAVLIDALSDTLVDPDDFSVPVDFDNEGNPTEFKFPALEEAAKRYPFVRQLISEMDDNNEVVAQFFYDMYLDYVAYETITEKGLVVQENLPTGQESAKQLVIQNYQNRVLLSDNSIYGTGSINRENAKKLLDRWKALSDVLKQTAYDFDIIDENINSKYSETILDAITDTLKALGFDVDKGYIRNTIQILFDEDKHGKKATLFKDLSKNINTILQYIADPKGSSSFIFNDNDDYLLSFNSQLNKISKIVGKISESDNIQSFRVGNEMRYSYSALNSNAILLRKIKSDKHREKLLEEYKQDPFFWHEDSDGTGHWLCEWLNLLENNSFYRDNIRLADVLSNGKAKNDDDKSNLYPDWDESKVYSTLISLYFRYQINTDANEENLLAAYNMPIYSDSPVCLFITMKRYRRNYKEKLRPLFVRLVRQEIRRQAVVAARKESDAPEIQSFDKRGSKFCFFPELNTYKFADGRSFVEVCNELVNARDLERLDNVISNALRDILDQNYKSFAIDAINAIGIKKLETQLKNLGVINKDEKDKKVISKAIDEALEEYFYNSTFATSQIIQLTTTDLAYYKNAIDFQKRFKQEYAAGRRLNTNVRYGRKIERTIYITDKINTSSSYEGLKKSLDIAVNEGRITEGEKNIILAQAKQINVADAQAYRNPFAFRAILSMIGQWTDLMDESFNRIINGEWDRKDYAIMYQTIKPFLKAMVTTDNGVKKGIYAGKKMRVPHQNKNSEFLCMSFFTALAAGTKSDPFLRGLSKFFVEHPEIDVVQFLSAVKAGGQGIVNLNYMPDKVTTALKSVEPNEDFEKRVRTEAEKQGVKNPFGVSEYELLKLYWDNMLDSGKVTQEEYNTALKSVEPNEDEIFNKLVEEISVDGNLNIKEGIFNHTKVHELPYENYMIAQPTPEHLMDQEDGTSGSQYNYLITANLPENFEVEIQGKKMNKKQLLEIYRACVVDNLLDSYEEVATMFNDIHELQKRLFKIMEGNPKYGSDIIEALLIVKIPSDKEPGGYKEVFNLPLDLPTVCNQVQELLTSVFKNNITKRKINGGNCIQVACTGISRDLNVLRDNNGRILGAECMLPAWTKKFFKPFLVKKTEVIEDVHNNKHTTTYEEIDIERIKKEAPDLLKMIGYRIPTEDKRSMLPLVVKGFLPQSNGSAIMLPADITLIAGSDFDVDKMYLRIPAIDDELYRKTNGKVVRKLSYDLSDFDVLAKQGRLRDLTDAGRMSKQQRDNLMIDIEYAILTSTEGTELIYNPGNFDTIKRNGNLNEITADPVLMDKFIQTYSSTEFNNSLIDYYADAFLEIINRRNSDGTLAVSNKDIEKFLEDNRKEINSLYPLTYAYFHHQNMTGKSLIGVYANGSSVHCKTQQTQLRLDEKNSFTFNNRTVSSLHDIRRKEVINGREVIMEPIQHNIAEFQAASVDNAKDPQLAKLSQNMKTAGLTLTMLRLGFSIAEVAQVFSVVSKGTPNLNKLSDLVDIVGGKVNLDINVSSRDLVKASIYQSRYPDLYNMLFDKKIEADDIIKIAKELYNFTDDEIKDFIHTILRVTQLYEHLKNIHKHLKPINDSMKADSPNNAIATGLPAAMLLRRLMDILQQNLSRGDSPFIGADNNKKTLYKELISNGVIDSTDSRDKMKTNLMKKELATPQAFYSLGIELPTILMKDYLLQGINPLWEKACEIMDCSRNGVMTERNINIFYRDFMKFILSNTKTFGDNPDRLLPNGQPETYDNKREYYLYYFPKRDNFLKTVKSIPELRHNNTISRIISKGDIYPSLVLPRSGRLTSDMKSAIRNDFTRLLYSDDPRVRTFAKDLFMYSYYQDGFNFGPESFGIFFDATFWDAFPEVIYMLRTFRESSISNAQLQKFIELYLANHAKDCCIQEYKSEKFQPEYQEDGSVHVRKGNCITNYSHFAPSLYIKLPDSKNPKEYRIYRLDWKSVNGESDKDSIISYVPCTLFDEPSSVYNINGDLDDMESVYWNNRLAIIEQKEKKKTEEEKDESSQDESPDNDPKYKNPTIDAEAPSIEELAKQNGNTMGNIGKDIPASSVENTLKTIGGIGADMPASAIEKQLTRFDIDLPTEAIEAAELYQQSLTGTIDEGLVRHLEIIAGTSIEKDLKSVLDLIDIELNKNKSDENFC